MDAIDYKIFGSEMQYVEVELEPGKGAVGEAGSLFFLEQGVDLEAVLGDGSEQQSGMFGKLMGAGKRLLNLMGEGDQPAILLAESVEQSALIGSPNQVEAVMSNLQKGFIMQKLEGDGLAFMHCCGTVAKRTLAPGENLRVDAGCLVAYEPTVSFDIQYVGGVKTALFGGEGLFFASLTGPGTVWLQSLPFSRLASRIFAAAPKTSGGEGSGSGFTTAAVGGSLLGGALGAFTGGTDDD